MAVFIKLGRLPLQCNRALPYLCLRSYGSALYMTGDEAKDTFSVVTPHIDIEARFKDMSALKQSVELRGMLVDVDSLKSFWEVLKSVEADRITLENRRVDIAKKIKEIKKGNDDAAKETEKLKLQGKLLREEFKITTKAVWELQKKVMIRFLSLPNNLHPDTPSEGEKIVSHSGNESSTKQTESHIRIGNKLDILDYVSPLCYYLKGGAAIFELCILDYFTEELCRHNFIKFCNSDFGRSVVVEGCGLDHEDSGVTYILQDTNDILNTKDTNRLHLVGGASLPSFCSFHAKQIIPVTALPLRLVAMGRQYKPSAHNLEETDFSGLFGVCQASSVELFISTTDFLRNMMDEFDRTMAAVTDIYKEMGFPFRVVYLPARSLRSYESLRGSFQMYSSYLKTYIEIGHISVSDDYISKRLLIRYEAEPEQKFTRIVSGTVVSVPKLLGCILELHDEAKTFGSIPMPESVKQCLF
ncbi:Serine--tRNA synthetase-like protein Slimp [Cryptotermes secundus]|uniref:Serine--tRNA synthetase-like protein Slimp n=1 Tax=Cryptotermes secundus TaxID=105785 RepID=A0A2J7Q5D9_9NEOP|nr:serine--tRNA synthetase-like protein Slimp [Cryptotermes secundus]PNF23797.1 Serine--tRNA synthetase-like protein Slimp [Cryptotermes secundus]